MGSQPQGQGRISPRYPPSSPKTGREKVPVPVLEFHVPAELVQVLPLSNQMKHLIVQIIHVLAELADIFLSVPGR